MTIRIGTENQNKIEGVKRAFCHYYNPEKLTFMPVTITTEEFGYPRSVQEPVDGSQAMREAGVTHHEKIGTYER